MALFDPATTWLGLLGGGISGSIVGGGSVYQIDLWPVSYTHLTLPTTPYV